MYEKDGKLTGFDVKTTSRNPNIYRVSMHSAGDWVLTMVYNTATGEILSKKRYRAHDFEYEPES